MFLGFAGGYLEVYWRSFGLLFGLCRADLGCAGIIVVANAKPLGLFWRSFGGYSGGLLDCCLGCAGIIVIANARPLEVVISRCCPADIGVAGGLFIVDKTS